VAVNITVRDIVNFPGGTAKTITVDIAQIVTVGGPLEGDEIWITSATTSATASGGGAIENILKNDMKRGFIKSSGLVSGLIDVPASYGFKVAIDEAIGSGVDITLDSGNNLLPEDIARDIEAKIKAQAVIGGGGSKIGNLSYLNAQVRFVNSKFQIESGTVSDTFTGTGRSSVALGAPDSLTDARSLLGLDITTSSESLAGRQISETSLASAYSTGDVLEVTSTAGFSAGNALKISDGTNTQVVVISGAGTGDGLTASQIRFVTASGDTLGLANTYASGSLVRIMHEIDVVDPVSAVTTVDQLYRFSIDSIVNQIDFSA
jgi:hypothetical protein